MSGVQTLLARCRELGAEFFPGPDGTLKVKAPAPLPEALREELKRRKQEILTLLNQQQNSSSYRDRYRQTAEAVLSDCFAIDPLWLADRHPELWERMALIDRQLERLEQRNAEQAEYDAMLQKLVATVKRARALFEQERQQKAAVQ